MTRFNSDNRDRNRARVTLESLDPELQLPGELPEKRFDWVDFTCSCPHCGRQVDGFRTKDLCNMLDTVDYRVLSARVQEITLAAGYSRWVPVDSA